MNMRIYLSSFYPLICTNKGRKAAQEFNLPPYIDGSCRREPDFENKFPVITGLCRPGFAEKLKVGDIVIYSTNKKGIGARKIVAVLEVIDDKSKVHEEAAEWYKIQKLSIPNNLMVNETKHFDLNKTHCMGKWGKWGVKNLDLEAWNNDYIERARSKPKVAICKMLYSELYMPPELTDQEMKIIFNRRPGTRNPSIISEDEWGEIKKIIQL